MKNKNYKTNRFIVNIITDKPIEKPVNAYTLVINSFVLSEIFLIVKN